MSWGSAKFLTFLSQACKHTETPHDSHIQTFPHFLHADKARMLTKNNVLCNLSHTRTFYTISILLGQKLVAILPRMKGPALLALLPDIPGHCSLLALPDVSPAPLSDDRRLDILELYRGIDLISPRNKDSQVEG